MKGNFAAIALILSGALVLAVNLDWLDIDVMTLLRKWWPMGLVVLGIALYFTPDDSDSKKAG
ncbi:LiaI-LiaF-like domain-containing protein [Dechloromonas denitrificans]|uniref:LiaI-LiaF-like domain-containing protein n=1 Tax=Azonexaceae TaxID=2008795 RepID=UPI001CF85298|nr:DUF5668 domain-containing protein [Dechloromonas denitrificans]UCV04927.1 hypothetical protein KI611_06620 [Dechloromonas denitrificans]UCV09309.1 hypothetical protein KI615_07220 [Dechloromonas denitrificans]